MKKVALSLILIVGALSLVKCGPAAEDRFKMHENAKHVSDSIAKAIDEALAKGAVPVTPNVGPVDTTKK